MSVHSFADSIKKYSAKHNLLCLLKKKCKRINLLGGEINFSVFTSKYIFKWVNKYCWNLLRDASNDN